MVKPSKFPMISGLNVARAIGSGALKGVFTAALVLSIAIPFPQMALGNQGRASANAHERPTGGDEIQLGIQIKALEYYLRKLKNVDEKLKTSTGEERNTLLGQKKHILERIENLKYNFPRLIADAVKTTQDELRQLESERMSEEQKKEAREKILARQRAIIKDAELLESRLGLKTPRWILKDPMAQVTPENIIRVDVNVKQGTPEDLVREAQEAFRNQTNRPFAPVAAGTSFAKHFSIQYTTFAAAMFLVSTAQLGIAYQDNPVAWEQWQTAMTEPMGAVGFGVFALTGLTVGTLLQGMKRKVVPTSMIPYVAMASGALASHLFHDLVSDKDMHKCATSIFRKEGRDIASCNKAFDNWVVTNKIMQYSPAIVSLLLSQAAADGIRHLVMSQYAKYKVNQAGKSASVKLVVKGVHLVPAAASGASAAASAGTALALGSRAAQATATAAAGGFTPVGIAIGLAQFTLFLAIDAVIAPPINDYVTQKNVTDFNFVARSALRGFHREYWWPEEGSLQAITNAFDVEAKTLAEAHGYYMDLLEGLQATSWSRPQDKEMCVPPEVRARANDPKTVERLTSEINLFSPFQIIKGIGRISELRKSDDQLRCEVLSQPEQLLSRYAEVNAERRAILINRFTQGQQNWFQMIGKFNDVYLASQIMGSHLADERAKFRTGGPRPNLSRERLAAVLAETLGTTSSSNLSHPKNLGMVRTGHVVDYVIASFACGLKPQVAEENPGRLGRAWNSIVTTVTRRTSDQAYVKTPFGSSFSFRPPNLTTGNGSICNSHPLPATIHSYEFAIPDPTWVPPDTFAGDFTDETGQRYRSLADYVFDKMDPEVFRAPQGLEGMVTSGFPNWWDKKIATHVESVWNRYAQSYSKLVEDRLVPVVFDKTFRNGCPKSRPVRARGAQPPRNAQASNQPTDDFIPQEGCKDGPMSLRVGNGSFLSIEIELRNYLRGLYSLLISIHPPSAVRAEPGQAASATFTMDKTRFLSLSNSLIRRVGAVNRADFDPEKLSDHVTDLRDQLYDIRDLLLDRMDTLNIGDSDFRREMLDQLTVQSARLIVEQGQLASEIRTMEFMDATSRPGDQNLYNRRASTPWNRGAQRN
jgi:hypothetical protein